MTLIVVDAVCKPSSRVNEDAWGRSSGVVWVVDGATGVGPSPYLDGPTDAAWFSREISEGFEAAFSVVQPTSAALLQGVRAAAEAAARLCDIRMIPTFELPSASLVLVREVECGLEFTNLGDSVIVWRSPGAPAKRFGSSKVGDLDEALHRILDQALASGLPRAAAVEQARALARDNRKRMNQPDGYWILDLSGAGARHAQIEMCPDAGPIDVLLMTDGFSMLKGFETGPRLNSA